MNDIAVLPQAARFLEALRPSVMAPRLAPIARTSLIRGPSAASKAGVRSCHVLDAKYEPGVRAVVLYEQAGCLLRGDLIGSEVGVPAGATVVDPGVAVSIFPDDPELPSLPRVMDPAQLGPALAAVIEGPWARLDDRALSRLRITLLRYRPGKRATLLVAHGAAPALVAKVYDNPAKAAAVVAEAPRLQALMTSKGHLAFAPVRAFLPEWALVVQQPVPGARLDVLLGGPRGAGRGAADGLRQAAWALAELHGGPVVTARPRPVAKELLRFTERAGRIATVDPVLGRAAQRLAERLMSTMGQLPPAHLGTVHGDCKPSQFLIGSDRVFIIDLDHCGVGDQAGDVGTFLATLRQHELRHALAGRAAPHEGDGAAYRECFTGEYLRRSSDRHLLRIRWHEAVALERKALRAFARAPRSPLATALIREAAACLDNLLEAA